jgi:hypothetical protein
MMDKDPRLRGAQSDIVAEELDRALQNIALRLDAGGGVVIASGPVGGAYAQFVGSLLSQVRTARPVTVAVANTEGSVFVLMIGSGRARPARAERRCGRMRRLPAFAGTALCATSSHGLVPGPYIVVACRRAD